MRTPYHRFDTEYDYRSAITAVIGEAQTTIRILDHDLQRMALHTRDTCDRLGAFLHSAPDRNIDIAVHDPEFILRNAPRLLVLHEKHVNQLRFRLVPEAFSQLADNHLLADRRHGVRRFHKDFARGSLMFDNPLAVTPWWHRFDELWELCLPLDSLKKTGL